MNADKRIRKPPKRFPLHSLTRKHHQKPFEKKQRLDLVNYAVIGLPPKHPSSNDIYLLPEVPLINTLTHFLTFL